MNDKIESKTISTADRIALAGQTAIAFGGFLLTISALYQLVLEGRFADIKRSDWIRDNPSNEIMDILRHMLDPSERY